MPLYGVSCDRDALMRVERSIRPCTNGTHSSLSPLEALWVERNKEDEASQGTSRWHTLQAGWSALIFGPGSWSVSQDLSASPKNRTPRRTHSSSSARRCRSRPSNPRPIDGTCGNNGDIDRTADPPQAVQNAAKSDFYTGGTAVAITNFSFRHLQTDAERTRIECCGFVGATFLG